MQDRDKAIEYITATDWRLSRLGLERVEQLLGRLGNPEQQLQFVHIAGTNGKSSTAALCAAMLAAGGCTTGLFTSPYVQRFNERIQVNGAPIGDDELVACTQAVRREADAMADHPTEFELVTAVGYLHFLRAGCGIVVLETGLGGRLDATNTIPTPLLALITGIGYDHTAELGHTLAAIAGEKAGIIKPGGDVLLCPQQQEADGVFRAVCDQRGARLHRVDMARLRFVARDLNGQRFDFGDWKDLQIGLLGAYQLENAAAALSAVELLGHKGFPLPEIALRQGLAAARWPARFELLRRDPPFILDGAHNPGGAAALAETLGLYFPGNQLVLLNGVLADKDWRAMVDTLAPLAKRVVCLTPDSPRALDAATLAAYWRQRCPGVPVEYAGGDTAAGVQAALAAAGPQDAVCAFGSLYMAGAIRALLTE